MLYLDGVPQTVGDGSKSSSRLLRVGLSWWIMLFL